MADPEQLLIQVLKKIAVEQALPNPEMKIQPASSGGANFTSQLFQVTLSSGSKKLNLFAKVAVVGEKIRRDMPILLFDMEYLFYTRLYNVYENLQDKHNVPKDKRFVAPKCYGCSDKMYEEVMVLEDLSTQGYEVYDRLKSVYWNYAARVVEEIARFHALSIAFQKEHKEEYIKLLERYNKPWLIDDVIQMSIKNAFKVVKEDYREKLERFFGTNYVANVNEMYEPLKLNVLVHGDNRISNQLCRKNEKGRMQVRMVDFQTIRGGPPVVDLLYFIFSSTDEKFRAQYYDQLLDHYYTELCLAMKRLHLNPEEIYTREDFDHEYRTKLPYGLSIAVFVLPVVTVDAANAPKVDKDMDMSDFALDNTSDLFPERLNGIIRDYIRWGIL